MHHRLWCTQYSSLYSLSYIRYVHYAHSGSKQIRSAWIIKIMSMSKAVGGSACVSDRENEDGETSDPSETSIIEIGLAIYGISSWIQPSSDIMFSKYSNLSISHCPATQNQAAVGWSLSSTAAFYTVLKRSGDLPFWENNGQNQMDPTWTLAKSCIH